MVKMRNIFIWKPFSEMLKHCFWWPLRRSKHKKFSVVFLSQKESIFETVSFIFLWKSASNHSQNEYRNWKNKRNKARQFKYRKKGFVRVHLINPIPPMKLRLNLVPNNIIQQCWVKKSASSCSYQSPFGICTDTAALRKVTTQFLIPHFQLPVLQFLSIHLPPVNPHKSSSLPSPVPIQYP